MQPRKSIDLRETLYRAYERIMKRMEVFPTGDPKQCWVLREGESNRIMVDRYNLSIAAVVWRVKTDNLKGSPDSFTRTCGNPKCYSPFHLTSLREDLQKHLPAAKVQALQRDYVQGMPMHEMTQKYGITPADIREFYGARFLRKIDRIAIVEAFASGMTQLEIAEEYGVSQAAICVILRKAGATGKKAERHANPCPRPNVAECTPATKTTTCKIGVYLRRRKIGDDGEEERTPFGL